MRDPKNRLRPSMATLIVVVGLALAIDLSGAATAGTGFSERYLEDQPSVTPPKAPRPPVSGPLAPYMLITTAVTPLQIASAMFVDPSVVTGASYAAVPPGGTPNGVGSGA